MNHAISNFTNKFSISFVIIALLFQLASPAIGVRAKSSAPAQDAAPLNSAEGPALSSVEGMTLGSEVTPEERASASLEKVPDFGEQVAAEAKAQPAETVPLRLKAFVSPAIYIPGKPLQIKWVITGQQEVAALSGPQLSIQAPAGVTPTEPTLKAEINAQGLLNLPESSSGANGQAAWTVSPSAKFPLNFSLSLTQNGQVVDQASVLVDVAKFNIPAGGGSINAGDGWVKVDVPVGAATQALAFDVRSPSPQQMPSVSLTGAPVEIVAVGKTDGRDVTQFKKPISIQMQYDPEKLTYPNSQNSLTIYYYNEDRLDWYPLETTVDTANHTLTAQSDHLTVFDYKANNWQTNSLPTVDGFKVSDFTGAATYGLSLWTPPGPGGMQPSLSLNYNSQIIDESSAFSQASWVGMGWSLDTGSITRNMHGTDNDEADDTFSISAGGISGTLMPIGKPNPNSTITFFKTAEDSFAKIQFNNTKDGDGNTTSAWTVWSKDGRKYVFNTRVNTNHSKSCAKQHEIDKPTEGGITWQWALTSVMDTTNIDTAPMTYTYTFDQKPGRFQDDPNGYNCQNIIAAYPYTITYPHEKYRVRFELEARNDYRDSWTKGTSRSLFGKQRLKTVWIEHNPSGVWNAVRRYDLTYALDQAANGGIYPNFEWNTTTHGRTLTLLGVQEKNGTGSVRLPSVLFNYTDTATDKMHLSTFNNGQGGSVQLEYQRWHYPDDLNHELRSLINMFGEDECNRFKQPINWTNWTGNSVVCSGIAPSTLNVTGVAERDIPENVNKPGAHFRYAVELSVPANTNVAYGIINGGTSQSVIQTAEDLEAGTHMLEASFEMPAHYNPSNTKLQLSCSRQCKITKVDFQLMPSFWRVTRRTLTDAVTSRSAAFTYHYDNAAPNTESNSDAIKAAAATNPKDQEAWNAVLYTPRLREYRGNAMSMVVDPNNLANITWYSQNDALKGRAYHTLTAGKNFYEGFDGDALPNGWTATPPGGTTIGTEFDNHAETKSTATTPVNLSRNNATITDGKMVVAHFRLSGTNARGEVGLVGSSTGQFFGLVINGSTVTIPGGSTRSFALDKWYVLELFVDNNDGFRLRLWQQDNPAISAEATLVMPTDSWKFRGQVSSALSGSSSILSLDAYFEGTPYAESETVFTTTTEYDTAASNGSAPNIIGANLNKFMDLAVTWSPATETSQRNYDGDASWIGTRSVYEYNIFDQGITQNGNLTRQTNFASIPRGGWAAYRGTKTQFFPNAAANLLSLPARQITLDCASGTCDFNGESGRLAETLYLYDNNAQYNAQPVKGKLKTTRAWARNNDYIQASMVYDAYGNVTSQTSYTGYTNAGGNLTSGVARTTQTTYDPDYHTYALVVTNPLGQPISMGYNFAKAVPNRLTDANGVVTTAGYDDFGRMISIVAPGDSANSPTLQIAYQDRIPFQVDLIQKIDGNGAAIRLSRFYDGTGKQIQTQTASAFVNGNLRNIVSDTRYDPLGRQVEQTVPYDIANRSAPVFSPQDFTRPATDTIYDVLGRATRVTQPNGNVMQSFYGQALIGSIPVLTTTVLDPKGNQTTSTADVWGRTLSVVAPTGPGLSYEYDALGQLKKATKGTGASATSTKLFYDQAGRKTKMEDPDMGTWTYDYDAAGNLTVQIDARLCESRLTYDSLNRLTNKNYIGSCASTQPITYRYDEASVTAFAVGHRTSMIDGSGTTTWTYDNRGRTLSEAKTINGVGQPFTTSWTYNSADLPVTMTYPSTGSGQTDGERLTYSYDAAGNLLSLSSSTGDTYVQGMLYDEAARLTSLTLGNNINRSFTYEPWGTDKTGGLLKTLRATSAGSTVQLLGYDYDRNGNIMKIDNTVAGERSDFTYDQINRLTSACSGAFSTQPCDSNATYTELFNYDANTGNLKTKGGLTLNYDDAGHKHAVTALGNAIPQQYFYDANGNMTQRLEASGLNRYLTYDAENRLVSVAQQFTPSPTPTRTNTATKSATATTTRTPTLTLSPSPTGTMTMTPTITKTPSPSSTATMTETPTLTATLTLSPSSTGTMTPSSTETVTPTATPTTLGPFVALSAGWSYACGLDADGAPACWGLNDEGQAAPPPASGGTFTQVSAGFDFTCGIKSDNTVACWGSDDNGQSTPLSEAFTQVSAGSDHTCGLKTDGTLACWGADYAGQAAPPSGTFTQVSTGWSHTCAISVDGSLACWGLLQAATPSGIFTQVSAGAFHTCAIRDNGSLACWGDNANGQSTPPGGAFTQVSAGNTHSCALKTDGTLACWGSDQYGQSTPPTGVFTKVSAGSMYTCALETDGFLECWGNDENGQLGAVPDSGFRLASYGIPLRDSAPQRAAANPAPAAQALTFTSNGADDGWILELSQASGRGGTKNNIAATFPLGDDAANKQYRAILSFDTSSLPDNAIIQTAELRIRQNGGAVGSNPFAALGQLWVDVRKGKFGDAYTLQPLDFQAQASAIKVASFSAATGWHSASLDAAGRSAIHLGNKTQFRLRFNKGDNNDNGADYMKFFSGDAAIANRPQLVITYSLPTPTPTPTITLTPTPTATVHFQPTPTLVPFTGASYVYDGDGNLVKSTVNGIATYHPSRAYQMTGATVTKYYGSYAMRTCTGGTCSAPSYLLSDHLGSTSLTLNATGQVVAELRYKAFGEVRYTLGNTPTDFRYTGQRQQADIGLYFYGARWYDAALGRFISADTIIPNAGSSQSWDRYSYVRNNPLRYSDPSGRCEVDLSGHMVYFADSSPQCGHTEVILSGSYGGDTANNPGPGEPDYGMPAWTTDQMGIPVTFVPYVGTQPNAQGESIKAKRAQAESARGTAAEASVALICYSGGTESCLMYARWRLENNQAIDSVVLLGPTFVASNETGVELSFGTPGGNFDDWADYLLYLHQENVPVLIVDDAANSASKASPENCPTCQGLYTYDNTGLLHNHWGNANAGNQATTTSSYLKGQVYNWILDKGWNWP